MRLDLLYRLGGVRISLRVPVLIVGFAIAATNTLLSSRKLWVLFGDLGVDLPPHGFGDLLHVYSLIVPPRVCGAISSTSRRIIITLFAPVGEDESGFVL